MKVSFFDSFFGQTKKDAGQITNQMTLQGPLDQFLSFLKLLHVLAESKEYSLLNAGQLTLQASLQDHVRIKVIFNYVMKNFKVDIAHVIEDNSYSVVSVL